MLTLLEKSHAEHGAGILAYKMSGCALEALEQCPLLDLVPQEDRLMRL